MDGGFSKEQGIVAIEYVALLAAVTCSSGLTWFWLCYPVLLSYLPYLVLPHIRAACLKPQVSKVDVGAKSFRVAPLAKSSGRTDVIGLSAARRN